VVVDADASAELRAVSEQLKFEYCIAVEGTVRPRPGSMANPNMPTGEIEVKAERIQILSRCDVLPFMIDERADAKEDTRFTYRYLDLRTAAMQRNMALRHTAAFATREYLVGKGFYEIETPMFIKSTPEGARDYLVPSRLNPGRFYALPQSRSCTSRSSWCRGSTATSRSPGASATRTRAGTVSPSSRRSTSK
jgi:aspartyl-tRNA synthetase